MCSLLSALRIREGRLGWRRMLAYPTETVDQELLRRNEYGVAENRVLRSQIKCPLRLTDQERHTLAEIGKLRGRKALEEVAQIVTPDTILAPYGPRRRGTGARSLAVRVISSSKSPAHA